MFTYKEVLASWEISLLFIPITIGPRYIMVLFNMLVHAA